MLQSRLHHGEVYGLLLDGLGKESGEIPADLLNTAPQCFSGTSLLLNATAAHMHFCYFSAPGTTVPSPLRTSAPLCPRSYPTEGKIPCKSNSHNQDRSGPDKQLLAIQHQQDMVPVCPMGTTCTEALRGWLLSPHSLLSPTDSQPSPVADARLCTLARLITAGLLGLCRLTPPPVEQASGYLQRSTKPG